MRNNLIIIDDDLPFRERLSRSMEKKGFNVESFGNMKKSIERIKEKSFDFAIVDMKLKDGSGLELIKLIKNIGGSIKFYNKIDSAGSVVEISLKRNI